MHRECFVFCISFFALERRNKLPGSYFIARLSLNDSDASLVYMEWAIVAHLRVFTNYRSYSPLYDFSDTLRIPPNIPLTPNTSPTTPWAGHYPGQQIFSYTISHITCCYAIVNVNALCQFACILQQISFGEHWLEQKRRCVCNKRQYVTFVVGFSTPKKAGAGLRQTQLRPALWAAIHCCDFTWLKTRPTLQRARPW